MMRILTACLTIVLGVVFVVAGASKAWAPIEFQRVVAFLLPESLRVSEFTLALVIGLAMLEAFLGLSVLTSRCKRGVLSAVIATLAAFSVALVGLAASPNAPRCGCLGIARAANAHHDAIAGLGRNIALIWMAAWLIRSKQGTVLRVGRRGEAARANGFTLIEVLVVIAILAVVLAMVVPALRHSRIAAKHNAQVQTIRQLNVALGMYCGDHRDQFPFFGTQGDPFGPIHIRGFRIGKIYFSTQRTYWASALLPEYYQGPRQSIEHPRRAEALQLLGYPDFIVAADYLISSTVFAHSRFWMEDPSGGTSWYQTSYFKPTRLTDVAYPSGKGLLVADIAGYNGGTSFSGWYPGVPPPVAFADGSARAIPQREFDPDPSRAVDRPFGPGSLLPVLATRDGLLGRDF
jgi:prepilin-type N-terminal cleavage/methylation domain-containing protein